MKEFVWLTPDPEPEPDPEIEEEETEDSDTEPNDREGFAEGVQTEMF